MKESGSFTSKFKLPSKAYKFIKVLNPFFLFKIDRLFNKKITQMFCFCSKCLKNNFQIKSHKVLIKTIRLEKIYTNLVGLFKKHFHTSSAKVKKITENLIESKLNSFTEETGNELNYYCFLNDLQLVFNFK